MERVNEEVQRVHEVHGVQKVLFSGFNRRLFGFNGLWVQGSYGDDGIGGAVLIAHERCAFTRGIDRLAALVSTEARRV